jgi:hypothetical protein
LLLIYFSLVDAEDVWHELVDEVIDGIFVEHTSDSIHIPHGNPDAIISFSTPNDSPVRFLLLQVALAITHSFIIEFSRPQLLQWLAHSGYSSFGWAHSFL